MENSPQAFFAGGGKKKDNTQPACKLAFGAKFQFTGDVKDGGQEAGGGEGGEGGDPVTLGSNHTHREKLC